MMVRAICLQSYLFYVATPVFSHGRLDGRFELN